MQADLEFFARRSSKHEAETTAFGIDWHMELSGPDGAHYFLFPHEEHTAEHIDNAKAYLKNKYDVTGFTIVRVPKAWYDAERITDDVPSDLGWVPAVREVLTTKSFRRINPETGKLIPDGKRGGVAMDITTANALITVYDAIKGDNQRKFAAMHILKAVDVAWKLIAKCGKAKA